MVDSKKNKKQQVTDFSNLLSQSKGFVIFDYSGMSAVDATLMRKKLFNKGSKIKIVKNNILRRALKTSNFEGVDESVIKGKIAVAVGINEILETLKVVDSVVKEKELMKFVCGHFDNRIFNSDDLQKIAKLPGRNELYGMFLSVLQAPLRKFLYALQAIRNAK
ncbi:50S ribosomal protein L10 [Mycoplasmoides genitalium]